MWRYLRYGDILDVKIFQMWRNFLRGGKILDLKKFEMYRVKYNMIHTVFPWHGWYLYCFVAKSVQQQCRGTYFNAIYTLSIQRKIKPKVLFVEKK